MDRYSAITDTESDALVYVVWDRQEGRRAAGPYHDQLDAVLFAEWLNGNVRIATTLPQEEGFSEEPRECRVAGRCVCGGTE